MNIRALGQQVRDRRDNWQGRMKLVHQFPKEGEVITVSSLMRGRFVHRRPHALYRIGNAILLWVHLRSVRLNLLIMES